MEYVVLDMEHSPRRAHFAYFSGMANPYTGVTVQVDITDFLRRVKGAGEPFFLRLLYEVGAAANGVPAFRQRILNGGVIEYAACHTSHTVLLADETFAFCKLDCTLPLAEFLPYAQAEQARVKAAGSIEEDPEESRGCFFISSLPWLSYTALVQAVPTPADSNPRISWGKYFESGGRTLLPLSVLVHHALADGKQIADFYENLNARLEG